MKQLRLTLIILTTLALVSCSDNQQQIQQLQTQLEQKEQTANRWQFVAFLLGTGGVVALIVGAAIGSKARKESHE